jgi:outer membrane protein TolC
LVTFITVLDAERDLASTRQQLTQSTVSVTTDLVALYKALGGGWEGEPLAADSAAPASAAVQ